MSDQIYKQTLKKGNQTDILNQVAEDLIDIETQIPSGGQQFVTYEKGKAEHIGVISNFSEPLRKIQKGEFRSNVVYINEKGSYTVKTAVPYTEAIENSRFPCGDYNITVGNQYNLTVGAAGINISTIGNRMDSVKGRYTVSTQEFNLGASGNINIRGSENISLLSRNSLTLEASNQVVVDSNLGVAKNAVINGCAFIDGELYINHITCPFETQYTGGGIGSFAQIMPSGKKTGNGGNLMIGWADVSYIKALYNSIGATKSTWSLPDMIPVFSLPDSNTALASTKGNTSGKNPEYSIFVYPHIHPFDNIPLTFTDGNGKMRDIASKINKGDIINASEVKHGHKKVIQ